MTADLVVTVPLDRSSGMPPRFSPGRDFHCGSFVAGAFVGAAGATWAEGFWKALSIVACGNASFTVQITTSKPKAASTILRDRRRRSSRDVRGISAMLSYPRNAKGVVRNSRMLSPIDRPCEEG